MSETHHCRNCEGLDPSTCRFNDSDFTRPSWDEYFLNICDVVAQRADCRRRRAASVIVQDHRIVATGYNGAPAGQNGCLAGGCPRGLLTYAELAEHSNYDAGPGRCVAVHAEANALLHANRADCVGATIYMTPGQPCPGCSKLIAGAGVARVVWREKGVVYASVREWFTGFAWEGAPING